jgi:phosphoglycolate phosphatase
VSVSETRPPHSAEPCPAASRLPSPHFIVFDLDGTLIDSAHDLADAVNDVLARRGLTLPSIDAIRRWIGEGAELLVERALIAGRDQPGVAQAQPTRHEIAQAVVEFRSIYATRCTNHTRLYDGAVDVMEAIRRHGLPTAILTNKPANQTATILHFFGLTRLVDGWLGGDSEFGRKPDPRPLRALVKSVSLAVPASAMARQPTWPNIWLVGDSATDIRTAHAAAAIALAVRGGYDDAEPIDECTPPPHRVLQSIRELPTLLGH